MRRALPAFRLAGLLLGLGLLAWWPASSRWGADVWTPRGLFAVEHGAAYFFPDLADADVNWRPKVYPLDGMPAAETFAGATPQRWKPFRRLDPVKPFYVVPLWVPAALLAAPWARSRSRWRRRRRPIDGRGFEVRVAGVTRSPPTG